MAAIRSAQQRETVAKVLGRAYELFGKRGFADTKIRDIATACGDGTGTVVSGGDK